MWGSFFRGGVLSQRRGLSLTGGLDAMDLASALFDNFIGRKRNVDGGVLAGLGGCSSEWTVEAETRL